MAVVTRNHCGISYHLTIILVTLICLPLSNNLAADIHHPTQHIYVLHSQASKPTHKRKLGKRLDDAAVKCLNDTGTEVKIPQFLYYFIDWHFLCIKSVLAVKVSFSSRTVPKYLYSFTLSSVIMVIVDTLGWTMVDRYRKMPGKVVEDNARCNDVARFVGGIPGA